jgi:hypothetical protein
MVFPSIILAQGIWNLGESLANRANNHFDAMWTGESVNMTMMLVRNALEV